MRGACAAPLSMEHNKLWVSAGYTHHLSNRGCEKNLFKGEPVRTDPCKISTRKSGREKTASRASEREGGGRGPNLSLVFPVSMVTFFPQTLGLGRQGSLGLVSLVPFS